MKHYIIVKYNDLAADREALRAEITKLFGGVMDIDGVHGFTVHTSATDIANRYDIMIIIYMDKDALPRFAQSDIHIAWKREYTKYMQSKAIFDSDD
jgi:quinol monooxygenase YgiN